MKGDHFKEFESKISPSYFYCFTSYIIPCVIISSFDAFSYKLQC